MYNMHSSRVVLPRTQFTWKILALGLSCPLLYKRKFKQMQKVTLTVVFQYSVARTEYAYKPPSFSHAPLLFWPQALVCFPTRQYSTQFYAHMHNFWLCCLPPSPGWSHPVSWGVEHQTSENTQLRRACTIKVLTTGKTYQEWKCHHSQGFTNLQESP